MSTLSWLKSHRVAVLKGGWSRERPISLKTGAAVECAFRRLGVRPVSIDVTPRIDVVLAKKKIQFCFIALHGTFGEDGGIQSILELMKIPYTGSGPLTSGIAMNKDLSKKLFQQAGVPTPKSLLLEKSRRADRVSMRFPLFVKPNDQGSAIGASRAQNKMELKRALETCFKVSDHALIEEFIAGRELTVGILGDRLLPIIEIVPEHAFYDFHSKYAPGGSRHLVPARVVSAVAALVRRLSRRAFDALACDVYGRVDLIVTPKNKVYVLEVNTVPGMTATSLLPDAARAVGISFDQLVLKICELSLAKWRS